MQRRTTVIGIGFFMIASMAVTAGATGPQPHYTSEQSLGGALYFDENLSFNRNQSCASCHLPSVGFDDPDSKLPVSQGSFLSEFGGRNAPSAAYAAFAPAFELIDDDGDEVFDFPVGGQFWDGRAKNLAEQASGPPVNSVEMAMPNKKSVIERLAENSDYVIAFKTLYGIDLQKIDPGDYKRVAYAYGKMANAIGEFERTRMFNQFNSKFDHYLAKRTVLNAQEKSGLKLYLGKAQCVLCHPIDVAKNDRGQAIPPLLTDFSYDNLGIPVNPQIAKLQGEKWLPPDNGLGGRVGYEDHLGKFKVMSLRNIAKTAPYGHNGYFKTLKEIVHFYNTRDKLANCADKRYPIPGQNCWPAAEVSENVNVDELGNLGLSSNEEDDVVAFLGTFSDGYGPSPFGAVPVPPMP